MPSPIELLLDPISVIIFLLYLGLMSWEALFPGRRLPPARLWKTRGITTFILFFYLSSYLPLWWDAYLVDYQLIDLSGLDLVGGTVIGLLVYELGVYVWHRSMHRSTLLWRVFHQMHHSAERLDSFGAFYFSPMDMLGWTLLGSLCLTLLVGITPEAATLVLLITVFCAIFQHSNIKTPRWLGYIVQRPESHAIHHARGVHAYNYSDLPLFDMLFGSFRNPQGYEFESGFYAGGSERIVDMLLFKDINDAQTAYIEPADTQPAAGR
ncbi:MAG: sterol desaturase family protein [gamma proteobacterium symbiont of Ctena orbiculata]